jgi:ABC-type lipoprotein export system ATPase subunit
VIVLRDVRKFYPSEPENLVLKGIHLHIGEGEFVCIVGTSGSGKSTLLNIVGGLDSHYAGSVQLDGRELRELQDRELSGLRNRRIGFVFQSFNLLDHLTVGENVKIPAYFAPASDARQLDERAKECLGSVGLAHKWASRPTQLSGGEKQRVAIARALLNRPRIFVCDEPTGSLDSKTSDTILTLFQQLNERERITLVMVTHDPAVSARASRVVRLEDGRVVEDVRQTPASSGQLGGAQA